MSSSSVTQTQEMAGDGGTTKARSMEKKKKGKKLYFPIFSEAVSENGEFS